MWVYKPVEKSAGIFSRAIAWTAWATKTLHLTLIKKTYSCHRSFTDTRSLRGSGPVEVCFGSGMKGTIKRAKKARGRRTARDRSISKAGPGKHLGAHVLVTGVRCRAAGAITFFLAYGYPCVRGSHAFPGTLSYSARSLAAPALNL